MFIAHAFRGEGENQNGARVFGHASELLLAIDVEKRVDLSEYQRCARVTFACSRAITRDFLPLAIFKTESFLKGFVHVWASY